MMIHACSPYAEGLLDIIAAKCQCEYLSDLLYIASDFRIRQALYEVEPAEYSLSEWLDAIEYLTHNSRGSFSTQDAAAAFLRTRTKFYKAASNASTLFIF